MPLDPMKLPGTTALGRFVRLPLALVPERAVVRVIAGPLRGSRWIVGSGAHGYWLGIYEAQQAKALASIVSPGDCVFDVGAHVGYFTLIAARAVGPSGSVVAFEPNPRNVDFLRTHLRLNRIANVEIRESAVSASSGDAFFDATGRHNAGHLAASGAPVRTVNLDEVVARRGSLPVPDVLKIDVEGAEVEVLEGARSLLTERRPSIFLATHGKPQERGCLGLLQELGYEVRELSATDDLKTFFAHHD